jgi:hypothetical protein
MANCARRATKRACSSMKKSGWPTSSARPRERICPRRPRRGKPSGSQGRPARKADVRSCGGVGENTEERRFPLPSSRASWAVVCGEGGDDDDDDDD